MRCVVICRDKGGGSGMRGRDAANALRRECAPALAGTADFVLLGQGGRRYAVRRGLAEQSVANNAGPFFVKA